MGNSAGFVGSDGRTKSVPFLYIRARLRLVKGKPVSIAPALAASTGALICGWHAGNSQSAAGDNTGRFHRFVAAHGRRLITLSTRRPLERWV